MGKYSNIVLVSAEGRIIDSIKHIDESLSSVREILPGGVYELPPTQSKTALVDIKKDTELVIMPQERADRCILSQIGGISPLMAREIVYSVFNTTDVLGQDINTNRLAMLKIEIEKHKDNVKCSRFYPCMIEDAITGKLLEFSAVNIKQYETLANIKPYESMNKLVDDFYFMRDMHERMRQKTADLTKLLNNQAERISKKISILRHTLQDAEKMDAYREYGDLITANIYRIADGQKDVEVENYFDENMGMVKIPLDVRLSPSQNAQRYYKKYNKAKTALKEAKKQLDASYDELQKNMGTPQEIANGFLENESAVHIKRRTTIVKWVIIGIIICLIIVAITFVAIFIDAHEANHGYFEISITDEGIIEETIIEE
jgi:predicted ribosome quality control (RQC) complex YloA/Tae2 family protein